MKELTCSEVEIISGAGWYTDTFSIAGEHSGGKIGGLIGELIPDPYFPGVVSSFLTDMGKNIGKSVGGYVGAGFEALFGNPDDLEKSTAL